MIELTKPLRVLNSFGERPHDIQSYKESVWRCCSKELQIDVLNHREMLGIERAWTPFELDRRYRGRDTALIAFYEQVYEKCREYDVFIVDHENVYHPDFIRPLSDITYTVLYTGDDPESSYLCSQPYVHAFDHVLCYAVYYSATTKMVDQLKIWGAKRANQRCYGWQMASSAGGQGIGEDVVDEDKVFFGVRDIDVIYVGGPYNKIEHLLKIKQSLGARFRLYGDWGGVRGWLSRLKRYGSITRISRLPREQLHPFYRRTKIGLNMHMSYGPSNLRMWQLPINGVMQITDNPLGTGELLKLGEEVVCYENGRIDQAIDFIHYYLSNDEERLKIAKAGYRRALKEYSYCACLQRSLEHIQHGMTEKYMANQYP